MQLLPTLLEEEEQCERVMLEEEELLQVGATSLAIPRVTGN